jgi:hypothetical protein
MDFKQFVLVLIAVGIFLGFLVWLNAYVAGGNILRFLYGAGAMVTVGIVSIMFGLLGVKWFAVNLPSK